LFGSGGRLSIRANSAKKTSPKESILINSRNAFGEVEPTSPYLTYPLPSCSTPMLGRLILGKGANTPKDEISNRYTKKESNYANPDTRRLDK
jgi:hypothetical protein